MTLAGFLCGFLIPWKFSIAFGSRIILVSFFDFISPLIIARAFLKKDGLRRFEPSTFLLPLLFSGLSATHITTDAWLHSVLTIYALWAGIALATLPAAGLAAGLRTGLLVSALLALPLWLFAPQYVTDHNYFCAFSGSKNGLAFLAGMAAFLIPKPAEEIRRWPLWIMGLLIFLTGSRGGLLALFAALLVLMSQSTFRRREWILLIAAMFGATTWLLATRDIPADRWEFASTIFQHADTIPWKGIGPGSGYGLDLYFKSWLESGLAGAIILAALIGRAILIAGLTPALAFILVFGIAHDPLRWPLFWMILAAPLRKSAVGQPTTS